jgi:hypothetical protein
MQWTRHHSAGPKGGFRGDLLPVGAAQAAKLCPSPCASRRGRLGGGEVGSSQKRRKSRSPQWIRCSDACHQSAVGKQARRGGDESGGYQANGFATSVATTKAKNPRALLLLPVGAAQAAMPSLLRGRRGPLSALHIKQPHAPTTLSCWARARLVEGSASSPAKAAPGAYDLDQSQRPDRLRSPLVRAVRLPALLATCCRQRLRGRTSDKPSLRLHTQSAHRSSACARTVFTASSCRSGG